ncbi:MAG TPA: hypothetical protein VG253_21170 [Streptosporangiaceae bacterium]|nr:hypothetical protein [Streptosporangiaceae bacterium]
MAEYYRASSGREPIWASGDLTLEAGFRLSIWYMQRPTLSLDTVARDLAVTRKALRHAITDCAETVTALSQFGKGYEHNMTPYRFQHATRQAEYSLARMIDKDETPTLT